jgi:MinD superfamily P-loop ATPase
MEICRYGAIAVAGETVVTFPELCHSCGGCAVVCPEKAITEIDRFIGTVETGSLNLPRNPSFGRGLMDIGQVMAPPIIRQLRQLEKEKDLTIIDAPPGTSCPVIASMKGADFVILVTEPTPFGLHDLTLAVEAVKLLGIPCGLVINRAGIGNDDVKNYARDENIPVLLEIPFDKQIASAYSKGELLVQALPAYKEKFKDLYTSIEAIVNRKGEA